LKNIHTVAGISSTWSSCYIFDEYIHYFLSRSCHAVTCVDCSVTFYGNDYAAHTSCISEAEKYEKSLYKGKVGGSKPKPQDIWNTLIEDIVSHVALAPTTVKPFLPRLAELSNVPRNQKKFINFAKNSLNIRNDKVVEDIWLFVDKMRIQRETEINATYDITTNTNSTKNNKVSAVVDTIVSATTTPATTDSVQPTTAHSHISTVENEIKEDLKEEKKKKKDKKRKRSEEKVVEEETHEIVQQVKENSETVAIEEQQQEVEEDQHEKKKAKKEKKKKDKKEKKKLES
jgi:cell growth-regulating nucleolar protein